MIKDRDIFIQVVEVLIEEEIMRAHMVKFIIECIKLFMLYNQNKNCSYNLGKIAL